MIKNAKDNTTMAGIEIHKISIAQYMVKNAKTGSTTKLKNKAMKPFINIPL